MQPAGVETDLWPLVYGKSSISPTAIIAAVERECSNPPHDFRTRLLLRDCFQALKNHFGPSLDSRLSTAAIEYLNSLDNGELGVTRFLELERRMANTIDPEVILDFIRELSLQVHVPTRLEIGGSSALILRKLLLRLTEDIDVVDEVPATIRVQHDFLQSMADRYKLRLTHFQSHYLPTGWENRLQSLGRFGKLDVFMVQALDIFVGKLFSKRTKDLDDLRILRSHLSREAITERLKTSGGRLMAEPALRADAERNWYILYGDSLPA